MHISSKLSLIKVAHGDYILTDGRLPLLLTERMYFLFGQQRIMRNSVRADRGMDMFREKLRFMT